MLTHAEFKSDAFPPLDREFEEVNPGRFGKRLADFLSQALSGAGEEVDAPVAEGWGWALPIRNEGFDLWLGVGNVGDLTDQFLCFIEPCREHVWRWFKRVPTQDRVEEVRRKVDDALRQHPGVHDLEWWSERDYNAIEPIAVNQSS